MAKHPQRNDGKADAALSGDCPGLDIGQLLRPISREAPAGVFLQYEDPYERIRQARCEEDAALPRGIWQKTLKKADWHKVRRLCLEVLRSRSKDLQIAVWLLEALIQLEGFDGVAEGFLLIHKLCETFWDKLYPSLENTDVSARVAPLVWMNAKLPVKLRLTPLTLPLSDDQPVYAFADWQKAVRLNPDAGPDRQPPAQGAASRDTGLKPFFEAATHTPVDFYESRRRQLRSAGERLCGLGRFLDEKCGSQAPSLKSFAETIDGILHLVDRLLNARQRTPGRLQEDNGTLPVLRCAETGCEPAQPSQPLLVLRSRTEAYRVLSEAADYLQVHDPHSPAPYLVKRAVYWGGLALPDLLAELIGDTDDRRRIYHLLGMNPHADG